MVSTARLFVAVPLPPATVCAVAEAIRLVPHDQHVRWLPESNWHITLTFLGVQDPLAIPLVGQAMRETIQAFTSNIADTQLTFNGIAYGPAGAMPRMVWLATDRNTSARLGTLRAHLESSLEHVGVHWQHDRRPFHGHVTLARFHAIPRASLPNLDKPFRETGPFTSLQLLESRLTPSGACYTTLDQVAADR